VEPASILLGLVAWAAALLGWWSTVRGKQEQRTLKTLHPAPLDVPLLVVIPARNEVHRLPRTLDRLLADPSPLLHVIVVDDASTDGTHGVVTERAKSDPRLSLRRPTWPPSADVFGKPRALDDAIRSDLAHTALVLCLDADVDVEPGALGALVNALGDAAALSVMPRLDDRGLVERALVPAFVAAVAATHPPSLVHDPGSPVAFLNGQAILLRRNAIDDVGGFAAVANTILEDVALGRLLKARGHALRLADGRALFATRMYSSFSEIVEGFGKNARPLHGRRLLPLALLLVGVAVAPWLAFLVAMVTDSAADDVVVGIALVIAVVASAVNRRRLGSSAWLALLSPVVLSVVAGVYIWAASTSRVRWRGRTFSI
jgi:cellulose synthase/poly-beta-1,6-N-acetylglucosamine synthase-like glycosyltransferase